MKDYTAIQVMGKMIERVGQRVGVLEKEQSPEVSRAIDELKAVQESLRKARLYLMQKA